MYFLESFPIKHPDGSALTGHLWAAGKGDKLFRLIVRGDGYKLLWDSKECPSREHCQAVLEAWMGDWPESRLVADPRYVPTVEEALRNPREFVDSMTETKIMYYP